MSFSLATANMLSKITSQGKGITHGKNAHGGVIVITPGHLTLDEVRKTQSDESLQSHGPIVSVEHL